jgi:uncharacterized protein YeaO (DUF488 family)
MASNGQNDHPIFVQNQDSPRENIGSRYVHRMRRSSPTSVNIQTYRYGEAGSRKGLYVGVARHLPRGIRREDFAGRGYFDVWLPLLAPSSQLVGAYRSGKLTCRQFFRRYRTAMREPATRHVIRLVAAVARGQPIHLGCFCADPAKCHRSVLKDLIETASAELPRRAGKAGEFFSPACSMPEIED